MSLKKSCSTWLAVYALAAAAVGAIVYRRFPFLGAALGGGLAGGGIVWLGLAYLAGVRTKIVEIVRLRSSGAGGPPRDGQTVAVVGTVEAESATLTSPIGGVQCVAYKYEVRHDDDLLYEGFALAPSAIGTPHGPMHILGYPDLQITPRDALVADALPQFRDYIAKTKFQELSVGDIRTVFADFGDTSGHIRRDSRMTHEHDTLTHARFVEWTLLPGQRVFATGHYSAQRGGIIPDPGMPLSLIIRDANDGGAVARTVRGAIGNLIGAAIFFAVAAAALCGFFAFVPLSATEQTSPDFTPTWREIRLERLLERRVRGRLRSAGLLDSGTPTVNLSKGSARGRVAAAGREVAVSRASATRRGDVTVIHIDDDLVVLTIGRENRPLRLRFGTDDVDPLTFESDLDVEITGSSSKGVIGRVTYFRDDAAEPACRVTFYAGKEIVR